MSSSISPESLLPSAGTSVPTLGSEPGFEPARQKPLLTIRPRSGWVPLHLREILQFRQLLLALAGRDLRLRYKQTALGIVWVVLQPLMAAGIFSLVFGSVAKLPSGGTTYFVFSFAGLLGWNLFNTIITRTAASLVGNSHLVSKVFFPRLILPLSSLGSSLVDFAVAAGMMAILLIVYGIALHAVALLLPIWIIMLTALALGVGLIASALAVSYRDIQHILPVFTQMLLYASPVAYSVSAVPESLRWLYLANPITPPLEAIRASLLGTPFPPVAALIASAVATAGLLLAGLFAFKRMERRFADVI